MAENKACTVLAFFLSDYAILERSIGNYWIVPISTTNKHSLLNLLQLDDQLGCKLLQLCGWFEYDKDRNWVQFKRQGRDNFLTFLNAIAGLEASITKILLDGTKKKVITIRIGKMDRRLRTQGEERIPQARRVGTPY